MDFLYIMPMPLDTLTMLASSLELITDMDMLLDMVQLETMAMLHMAIMVMAMEELGLFTAKDKKKFDTGQDFSLVWIYQYKQTNIKLFSFHQQESSNYPLKKNYPSSWME